MKVCFPVQEDRGLESSVFGHFGSAPLYLLVDTESGEATTVKNGHANHAHGQCNPTAALEGTGVTAVVVGGIGPGALSRLISANVDVYQAASGNVSNNVNRLKSGELLPFSLISTCAGKEGGCAHH